MLRIVSLGERLLRRQGYIVVLILAMIGLGACVSLPGVPSIAQPEDWSYRWLKGIPCRAPCWEGITPGQTTAEEEVQILQRSPIVTAVKITAIPGAPDVGVVEWNWTNTGRRGGGAEFHAQTPSSPIYLVAPIFPVSFKLGDVIQAYGEPSHIIASSYYGPDIDSGVFYDLSILYLPQGFIIGVAGGRVKPTLSVDTLSEAVVFFAPGEEGLRSAFQWAAAYPNGLIPWQGMKDFDYYCRDEAGKPCP